MDEIFKFSLVLPPKNPSILSRIASNVLMASGFIFSKAIFAPGLNKMKVMNKEILVRMITDHTRPLITVSNHRCVCDDPLYWALFTWKEFFSNISRCRYILAAHNICFKTSLHGWLFSRARAVPAVRGAGVYQKGVDFCIEKLNENAWVHVFPEGKVTPDFIRIKWGVARMIMECKNPPILLPFWIDGMANVWPTRKPYRPHFGKNVTVAVGKMIDMADKMDLFSKGTILERRKALADFIERALLEASQVAQNISSNSTAASAV